MKRRFENMDVRAAMYAAGIYQEDVARFFGIRRETVNCHLSKNMTAEQRAKYLDAIEQIKQAGGSRV